MSKSTTSLEVLVEAAEAEWMELFEAGPQRLRWTAVPPQVGDDAPDVELLDLDGRSRSLHEFWTERPTIVMFWRHFGCNCGIECASRLSEEYPKYVDAGANVVVVTEGEPARAARYAEKHGIDATVLCDPERQSYEAFGLLDFGVHQVLQGAPDPFLEFDPAAGAELAADRREMDQHMVDNPWQQPGAFLVDTDGVLRQTHRYQYCEDYPDPEVFLTALRMLD